MDVPRIQGLETSFLLEAICERPVLPASMIFLLVCLGLLSTKVGRSTVGN